MSSAAAEQHVSDEGTLGVFPRVSDAGRHFSGYSFFAVDKSDGIRFKRVSGPKGGAHGCAE